MNNKTVILEPDQWMECWKEMCEELGYVPSWDGYSKYFSSISCKPSYHQIHGHAVGLKIVFDNEIDAMAFKLRWI